MTEHRANVDELGASLRDRVLSLDEPVSRQDWADVARRSGGRGSSRIAIVAVLAIVVLGTVGVVAFAGFHHNGSSSATGQSFRKFSLAAPPIAAGAIASQTRMITSAQTSDGKHTLYVAPAKDGGFCYEWTGSHASCQTDVELSPASYNLGKSQIVGSVSTPRISVVKIKFTDGTTADPAVSWVSAPINAGFFLYDIPAGKIVAEIKMA